ncbi:hypothetical protein ACFLX9_01905 [Chloroflexota bacterium]
MSPQDNAFEVMGLIPDGDKLFEVISRYDDLLALESREGYEAGDTLALIVPFLLLGRITVQQIRQVSQRAGIVGGVADSIKRLRASGWEIFIISTGYDAHALNVARTLSISDDHVYCTKVPPGLLDRSLSDQELNLVQQTKEIILSRLFTQDIQSGTRDTDIKQLLDEFYWKRLPQTSLGVVTEKLQVRGGRRKAWALEEVSRRVGNSLRSLAFVGDSVTDMRACQLIDTMGGMAIAFNGNEYVIPYATVGIASEDFSDILPVLEHWQAGGRSEVRRWIESEQHRDPQHCIYDWLSESPSDISGIVAKHRLTRSLVRQRAAKLG